MGTSSGLYVLTDVSERMIYWQLLVLAAHQEEHIDAERTVEALTDELKSLANWLDLDRVKVSRRGPLARRLADCVRAKAGRN